MGKASVAQPVIASVQLVEREHGDYDEPTQREMDIDGESECGVSGVAGCVSSSSSSSSNCTTGSSHCAAWTRARRNRSLNVFHSLLDRQMGIRTGEQWV